MSKHNLNYLIASSLLVSMPALANTANVSVYGVANVSYDFIDTGSLGGKANTGASQLSLGYDHRLSKRTTLFAVYTKLSNESAANYGPGNAAFSSGVTPSIGADANPSALSFGMKHAF